MKKILSLTAIVIVSDISIHAQSASCSLTRVSDSLFSGECRIGQRTLFCALYYASTDIMGDFYAGPSFQAIIDAVKRVRKGAQHPIQAFNDDPKTTFAELHEVLNDAINRMEKEIKTSQ